MTEIVKICDTCGKRVNWLYKTHRLIVEGNVIKTYPSNREICKDCAMILCEKYNSFSMIKADNV